MQITVENAGGCRRILKIVIPKEMVSEKLNAAYKDLNKQVQLPGFRKGKAPKDVLAKRYGAEILEDVRQNLADEALKKAIDEQGLQVLGQPEVTDGGTILEGADTNFTIDVEVRPEFELPEYKGLEVNRPETKIEDWELQGAMRQEQVNAGKLTAKGDAAAVAGDFVRGDIHIVVDGKQIFHRHGGMLEAGTERILGLELPDAKTALIGLKKGDHKEVPVTLPADFGNEEFRGKSGAIDIVVHDILKFEGPTLEETAKENGHESLDEWKEEIRDDIRREKDADIDRVVEEKIVRMIVEKTLVELPERFSKLKASELLQRQAYQLYQQGAPDEEVQKFLDDNKDAGLDRLKDQLKEAFLLDAISRKERLVVTEDEINRHVGEMAAKVGRPLDEVYGYFRDQGMLPGIRDELKTRKVMKLLRQKAKYV